MHDNFFILSPTLNHIHPLQVENCDSNSRLVVDEDDNGKFRLERARDKLITKGCCQVKKIPPTQSIQFSIFFEKMYNEKNKQKKTQYFQKKEIRVGA